MARAPDQQSARGIRHVSYNIDQFSKTDYWQVVNHTTIDLNDALQLKNIVSYSEFCQAYAYDYDGTANPVAGQFTPSKVYPATGSTARQRCTQNQNVFSEELQLQARLLDGGLQFTLGGYTDKTTLDDGKHEVAEFDYFPLTTLLGQPLLAYVDQRPSSKALFAQIIYDLGQASSSLEGLSLTAGYRYTWDKTRTDTFVIAPPVLSGGGEFKYGSYTFTLDYEATRGLHLYGTARSAYKAGGVNGPVPEGSEFHSFPPEKLSDVEIGLKSQFSVGGVAGRANLAVYRGSYDNIQRTTQDVVDPTPNDGVDNGVVLNVTRSAAKGRVQGVEFTGTLLPIDNLTLNATYSYIDAKYTRFASTSSEAILTGAAFPYTPKRKYTVGARYDVPLGVDIGTLGFSVNYTYQGEFSTATTNQATIRDLPGYSLLNLRAELAQIGGRPLDLAFFMSNVANKEYKIGLFDAYTQPFGFITYTYGEPRMYGMQLSYHFGE
jgi:iron complex outermembrane receptor protein